MSVLAIDAGTTGVTALVVGEDGGVVRRGYEEFPQHFPQPGWVEHEPEEIWQATLSACRPRSAAPREQPTGDRHHEPARDGGGLGPRDRLAAPRRAIVWQDRRTARDLRRAAKAPATSRGSPS